jgi:hypothetical protein
VDYRLKKLNEVIRGWINYFALADMKTAMARIDEHLRTLMRVIIWKQWKVPTKRKWGLQKLGVPEWLANKTSQWGDHYIFIATKSCLKRAVSKEILTRRGLVRPSTKSRRRKKRRDFLNFWKKGKKTKRENEVSVE